MREGRLFNEFIGMPIVVKDSRRSLQNEDDDDRVVVHEVKKLGLLIDRYVDIELRIGDILVIYISRAAEELPI